MTCDRLRVRIKYLFLCFAAFLLVASGENAFCSIPKEITKNNFCDSVNNKFLEFGWHGIRCNPNWWNIYHYSSQGNPLLYKEFGFHNAGSESPVNLLFCGVHGDEPSAVYICFQLVREILFDNPESFSDLRLVIAPIVNPDGFFANTRENANGVDPNRNLPTKDWGRLAQKVWTKYKKDPRKYPGAESGTEVESKLQMYLINKYKPDKIISVHAPLGFLDFDGPGDQKYRNLIRIEKRAKYLGLNMEANSKNLLKLVDFRFFPGSLGNYAGNERNIPTYTIELPSSDPSMAQGYWTALRFALLKALRFEVYDREERNPFFSDDTVARRAAYAIPEPVSAAEGDTETKSASRALLRVNLPEGGRVLVLSCLLMSFVAFQLVILQRRRPVIESSCLHNKIIESETPAAAPDVNVNPDGMRRMQCLSRRECDALVHACEPHLTPIVITALNTGMKKNELLNLKWEDVDFDHGCIILDRAMKSERMIPLNDTLKKSLGDIPKHHDVPYVFYNKSTGKPYRNITKSFTNALRRAGIKNIYFSDLRHTFAARRIMDGMDINTVMKLMGYKTAKAGRRYAHLATSQEG